jgi:N6-L-threonylcarbamoyladenine synthase
MEKLILASKHTGIKEIAIAGGVSANSGLKKALSENASHRGWRVYIPEFQYTMDNAAMIAVTGYFKYLKGQFDKMSVTPQARYLY